MDRIDKATVFMALMGSLLVAPAARAVSPAVKCEASKLGSTGKYDLCRLKAEAKAAKTGESPDFSKCDPKFTSKWALAESTAGGTCPSSGDEAAVQAFITEHTDALRVALGGGTLPEGVLSCNADLSTCDAGLAASNGELAGCNGELAGCDVSLTSCLAMNCGTTSVLKTGQTSAFGAGSDGDLQKGAARSYTDNGDGTVTDNATGLMWEKKTQDGSIHDWGNTYTWSGASFEGTNSMDGTIISTFLATLNGGGGFAGHTDWRIPNRFELESLITLQSADPAVDSAFNTNCVANCTDTTCSCSQTNSYWSSTTIAGTPLAAWTVDFSSGNVLFVVKSTAHEVRAVRGGS